jgi:hypothetical protein
MSPTSSLRPSSLGQTRIAGEPRLPASAAQRAKVLGLSCAVCGRSPVDPAHLVPRRLGGCGHRDCVIGLCRTHHRLFDRGALRLAAYLGPEFEPERRHALTHVGAAELERALRAGWPAPWIEDQPKGAK